MPEGLPDELELLFADMNGIPRGKSVPGGEFSSDRSGKYNPHFAEGVFFQTIFGTYAEAMDRYIPMDRDLLMRPDWSTCTTVPWKNENVGQVVCTTTDYGGKPIGYDPRNVLKRVLAAYKRTGLRPVIAPEFEFYLLDPVRRDDLSLMAAVGEHGQAEFGGEALSIDALQKFDPVLKAIREAAKNMSIYISGLTHELGPGQIEVNIKHGEALTLADQTFLLKRMIKGCALNHGVNASFMSKPLAEFAGSGLHLHISLLDRNDHNPFKLKRRKAPLPLRHFIAGLQKYLPHGFALLAPNVNSYKRFVKGLSAPINLEWGYDNRTTGLRVPYGNPEDGRVECRVAGADANPYLAVAIMLAAGLLGLREGREPSKPVDTDAYFMDANLPSDLAVGLRRLNHCKPLGRLLGREFIDVFSAVKGEELEAFSSTITPWETQFLGTQL